MRLRTIEGGVMRQILFTATVAFIAVAVCARGPAQAEMASGAVLANTCFSCHGTDGRSAGDMPTSPKSTREP